MIYDEASENTAFENHFMAGERKHQPSRIFFYEHQRLKLNFQFSPAPVDEPPPDPADRKDRRPTRENDRNERASRYAFIFAYSRAAGGGGSC